MFPIAIEETRALMAFTIKSESKKSRYFIRADRRYAESDEIIRFILRDKISLT